METKKEREAEPAYGRSDEFRRMRTVPKLWDYGYIGLRNKSNLIREDIKKYLRGRKDLKILDVGCETKPYEPYFRGKLKKYIGLDKCDGPNVNIVADALDMPIKENEFDVVISTNVSEHVEDYEKYLSEIRRVLKSGGIAFVTIAFMVPVHSPKHDYWRFTNHAIPKIFKGFKTLSAKPNTTLICTLGDLFNSFIRAAVPVSPFTDIILKPFFLITNIITLLLNATINAFLRMGVRIAAPGKKNMLETVIYSAPKNWLIVAQKT